VSRGAAGAPFAPTRAPQRGVPAGAWALLPIGLVYWQWWSLTAEMLAELTSEGVPEVAVSLGAAAAVSSRLGGHLLEAGFWWAAWRPRGEGIPFGRLFTWVVVLSAFDLIGHSLLVRFAPPGTVPAPWLALLTGVGALPAPWQPLTGVWGWLGTLGLLTALRLGVFSLWLAEAAGGRRRTAALAVLAAWLGVRVAFGWLTDLMRGMSPLS
jgi:hypothetical protein